jgi:hypothetical protein
MNDFHRQRELAHVGRPSQAVLRATAWEGRPTVRLARWRFGFVFVLTMLVGVTLAAAEKTAPPEPSARAYVSARIINHFLARAVTEQTVVAEQILKAWTEGTQTTTGTLTARTVPNGKEATLELILAGQSTCPHSVSYQGPATVYSATAIGFDARARVCFANDVLRLDSVGANSNATVNMQGVESRSAFLEPIVRRRANKKLPEVEAAASDRHSERVSERLRQQVGTLVTQGNEIFAGSVKKPLAEVGAWPRLQLTSSEAGLHLVVAPLAPEAPGTKFPAPRRPADCDFFLCVHDSILEQVVGKLLGGKEIADDEVLHIVELLTGSAPRHLWVHDRAERWSVVLAPTQPLRISFRDGAMHVVVEVRETYRGTKHLVAPVRASASFEAKPTVDGLVLVRRGDVKVEVMAAAPVSIDGDAKGKVRSAPVPATPIDEQEIASLHTFLSRKFGAIFPEEFHFDALAPPSGGFGEKFRQVPPRNVSFENGWFAIDYEIKGAAATGKSLVKTEPKR